jgi:hypothetical protein
MKILIKRNSEIIKDNERVKTNIYGFESSVVSHWINMGTCDHIQDNATLWFCSHSHPNDPCGPEGWLCWPN